MSVLLQGRGLSTFALARGGHVPPGQNTGQRLVLEKRASQAWVFIDLLLNATLREGPEVHACDAFSQLQLLST
eukprot:1152352-Pelagomonas_calceolata.AAC.4